MTVRHRTFSPTTVSSEFFSHESPGCSIFRRARSQSPRNSTVLRNDPGIAQSGSVLLRSSGDGGRGERRPPQSGSVLPRQASSGVRGDRDWTRNGVSLLRNRRDQLRSLRVPVPNRSSTGTPRSSLGTDDFAAGRTTPHPVRAGPHLTPASFALTDCIPHSPARRARGSLKGGEVGPASARDSQMSDETLGRAIALRTHSLRV